MAHWRVLRQAKKISGGGHFVIVYSNIVEDSKGNLSHFISAAGSRVLRDALTPKNAKTGVRQPIPELGKSALNAFGTTVAGDE